MKCVITGHTSGIGKALQEYFLKDNWEVVGMSRSNGYDIQYSLDRIITDSKGCDLFINCASSGIAQLEIARHLCLKVPKLITFGSCGSDFIDIWGKQYTLDKFELEKKCRLISLNNDPNLADMLFIKIAYAETTYSNIKIDRLNSDFVIYYKEIYDCIKFWLSNSKIRQLEFQFKLTDYTIEQIKRLSPFPDKFESLYKEIKELLYFEN